MPTQASPLPEIQGGAGGADVHQSAVSSFCGALPVLEARVGSTRTCEKVIMMWADTALK